MTNDFCSSMIHSRIDIYLPSLTNNNVNLPTLGPTFINFYSLIDSKSYLGNVLLTITAESLEELAILRRKPNISTLLGLNESEYWSNAKFFIKITFFDFYFINTCKTKLKIQIYCGGSESNEILIDLHEYPDDSRKFALIQPDTLAVATLEIIMADNRIKFESNVKLRKLYQYLKEKLQNFENDHDSDSYVLMNKLKLFVDELLKIFENTLPNLYFKVVTELTKWDQNDMKSKIFLIENAIKDLKNLKSKMEETTNGTFMCQTLINNVFEICNRILKKLYTINLDRLSDKWPDLWIFIKNGNRVVAEYKTDPNMYLDHPNPEYRGELCFQPHSIVLKVKKVY